MFNAIVLLVLLTQHIPRDQGRKLMVAICGDEGANPNLKQSVLRSSKFGQSSKKAVDDFAMRCCGSAEAPRTGIQLISYRRGAKPSFSLLPVEMVTLRDFHPESWA